MRTLTVLFAVLTIVAGTAATPSPLVNKSPSCLPGHEHCAATLPTPVDKNRKPTKTTPFQRKKLKLTNAERLARGLPLNQPHRRSKAQDIARRQESDTPEEFFRVANAQRTGVVSLNSGEEDIGYVSAVSLDRAIYKSDAPLMNAAIIAVDGSNADTFGQGVRLTVSGSDFSDAYPLLGLVQGRDNINQDIGPGLFHYLYVTGVALPGSQAGSIPGLLDNAYGAATTLTRAAETDVWDINFDTGLITAQWVNSDGSTPQTYLFLQGGALYATGDPEAFSTHYGGAVTPVSLKLLF